MEQWYKRNKRLYDAEVKLMKERFPAAQLVFFESNGNMCWTVKLKISKTDAFEPWTFAVIYMPDHPHNNGYTGSIKVVPLSPSYDELLARTRKEKQKYFDDPVPVPHILIKDDIRYLCTRDSKDIENGISASSSAVQSVAWAAEWALYFELAMRDNRVWNKWVDDTHFRKWKIK